MRPFILPPFLLLLCASSCSSRGVQPETSLPVAEPAATITVGGREVDILAVVTNASSAIEPDEYLAAYHALFETLLDDPACTSSDRDRCRVADVRVGVTTGDLGMGPYTYPNTGCVPGGDGGRLQTTPLAPGCTPPGDPWASLVKGESNVAVEGSTALARFLEGFDCIAGPVPHWCGFQQHLEAARKALDPALGTNPGFLRDGALLAVAVATDRDDCSAAKTEFFSIDQSALDELGPLTLFRCDDLGLQCDEPFRAEGDKHNCHPAQDWLVKVDDYVQFLRTLRPGRALFFAVAGPPEPVAVARDVRPSYLVVKASCNTKYGAADPAVRLRALADALGPQGLFNPGGVDACVLPLDPAFKALGESILAHLESQCLPAPLVTASGGLICSAGDEVAPGVSCGASCLDLADCTVEDVTEADPGSPRAIPRCPTDLAGTDCGAACPCWRLVPKPDLCSPQQTGSPYALQVLRSTGLLAPSGTHARATCRTTTAAWGSEAMAAAKQCR